jgi:hypothetical protein
MRHGGLRGDAASPTLRQRLFPEHSDPHPPAYSHPSQGRRPWKTISCCWVLVWPPALAWPQVLVP